MHSSYPGFPAGDGSGHIEGTQAPSVVCSQVYLLEGYLDEMSLCPSAFLGSRLVNCNTSLVRHSKNWDGFSCFSWMTSCTFLKFTGFKAAQHVLIEGAFLGRQLHSGHHSDGQACWTDQQLSRTQVTSVGCHKK